jgi:hypothetical protein
MLIALFFGFYPYFIGSEAIHDRHIIFENINLMLIFVGLAISFASLQDPAKVQNRLESYIYHHPKRGKAAIIIIILAIFYFLGLGLYGYFLKEASLVKELSVGLIILSLGMFGFLKIRIEIFENHFTNKRRNTPKN